MGKNDRHVVPNPEGGWAVDAPGAKRASSHCDTQATAIDRAREIIGKLGGSEVVIHGKGGTLRDKDTVPPGNPCPATRQVVEIKNKNPKNRTRGCWALETATAEFRQGDNLSPGHRKPRLIPVARGQKPGEVRFVCSRPENRGMTVL